MIRLANKHDVDKIMVVINDAKELFKNDGSDQWQDKDNYPNEQTISSDIEKEQMYVYTVNEEIVGCVALSSDMEDAYVNIHDGKWLSDGPYTVIHRIAIRKDMYRKNIAFELIEYCKVKTKELGINSIKVDTKKENIRMISLLKKCGFIQTGIIYLLREGVLDKERIAFEWL